VNRRGEVCECGCWSSRHKEVWDEATDQSFWKCTGCDECDDFRGDPRETRERENEYKTLQEDIRRGK